MPLLPGQTITPKVLGEGGTFSGTTDTTGHLTVTHGLPFTPSRVLVQPVSPISGANIFAAHIVDTLTATTFRVRALNHTGAVLNTIAITGHFQAWP